MAKPKHSTSGGITPQQIVKFRKDIKCTQNELAELLNVHRRTVQRWEQGLIEMTGGHLGIVKALLENMALRPEWQKQEIRRICAEAVKHGGMAAMINQLLNLVLDGVMEERRREG